jgi:quercetin dioxygenase-like cupin family protein
MPFVPTAEALNQPELDLDQVSRAQGLPPWRVALIGTAAARWVLIEWPAGYVSVPHRHPHAQEVFFIVRGQAAFSFGDDPEPRLVGCGAMLFAPPDIVHTIAVQGDQPLLLLCSLAPNEDRVDETVEQPR